MPCVSALKDSFLEPGTPRESVFLYTVRWKSRIRSTAEGEASPLEKDSWSDGTGRRSDPTNETIRASAKQDAVHRNGSRELLLRT